MTQYKKFRMVGPMAVYIHKETGKLAVKDDDRFIEVEDMAEVERLVEKQFPQPALDVIQQHYEYHSGNPAPVYTNTTIRWHISRREWINPETGRTPPHNARFFEFDGAAMAQIELHLKTIDQLRQSIELQYQEITQITVGLTRIKTPGEA